LIDKWGKYQGLSTQMPEPLYVACLLQDFWNGDLMTYYQIRKVREYLYGQATKQNKNAGGEYSFSFYELPWGGSYEPWSMYEIKYT
jgi:hypothetical protein